jgi:hypothetical protein
MKRISHRLSELNYTLLSGGADGADSKFQEGHFGKIELYLPWPNFRHIKDHSVIYLPTEEAYQIAESVHPVWQYLPNSQKHLMARNSHQILGKDLRSPVDFVVCWTPDGCESHSTRTSKTGGTGQAISLASINNIPVFNLFNSDALTRLADFVNRSIHDAFCDDFY